jgi:uncharacterized protein (DUF1330 family)
MEGNRGGAMPAYVLVGVDVTDLEPYGEYTRGVPATLEPYGGCFVVRGGEFEVLEGDWPASRIVVLTFPDVEQAKAWHESVEYQAILPIRQRNARTHFMVAVDGVDGTS